METLQRTANRGSISTGFDIENSLKLEKDNNEHLYRVMVEGNRKTWTYSCWIKRTELLQVNAQVLIHFGVNHHATRMFIDDNNDQIYLDVCSTENTLYRSITNRRFRDTSAWYHIVWRMDTTQGTEADRMRLYINGVEETSWSQHQIPPQNLETLANTTAGGYDDMGIGTYVWAGSSYDGQFSGYIAQVAHVDGQSYAPTEFGEFDNDSGIWKPKDVSGLTYGTSNNSFFLDFETASDLGANAKGNDVNFSLNNITAADQATDTPTNNFCTLNPLIYDINSGDDESYSCFNGATSIAASKNAYAQNYATIGLNIASGGKWYFEWTATSTANGSSSEGLCGLAFDTQWDAGSNSTAVYNAGYAYYAAGFGSGDGYAANVVNGFLIDLDNNKIKWYKDGTLHITMPDDGGGSTMQTSGYAFPYIAPYGSGYTINVNFGGYTAQAISSGNTDPDGYGNFEYPTQDGYAICTKNLAEYG